MAKGTLAAMLIACMVLMAYATPVKQARAVKAIKQLQAVAKKNTANSVKFILNLFDENKNGGLEETELATMLGAIGNIEPEDALTYASMAMLMDANENGKLDENELANLVNMSNP